MPVAGPSAAELERLRAVSSLPSGLPLISFVTPGGKLRLSGTNFPHEHKGNKPALEDVLRQALRTYRGQRPEVDRDGAELKEAK